MEYKIFTFKERPDLKVKTHYLVDACWPVFMQQDPVANRYWGLLSKEFAEFQVVLCDENENVLGTGNTIPLTWDGTPEDLPDGWDAEFLRGVDGYQNSRQPDTLGALAIQVNPELQGQGLSKLVLQAMRNLGKARNFKALIAPVRPALKHKYPLTPIERYITWQREDGTPFDPWMRVHWQLGAKIVQALPRSMEISGTVADWEKWTKMRFPESGEYIVPGALQPVTIDRENDRGFHFDPNVWMVHRL